ncbi:hypothetical protein C8J56DRAFT_884390 [Mycena floridula]|nr:hypothetical protein C8J56DRAFT_884390 [Mycena floridula]
MVNNDKGKATLAQAGPHKPCEISDRTITPQLMHEFNCKQCTYFLQKDIGPDDQVKNSLACFMDNRRADKIIDNHHADMMKMDWPTFMKWIKECLLPEKWAEELLTELMGTKMRKGDLFKDQSEDMVFGNCLLEGMKQHQSDVQLQTQVTANLSSVLHLHAFSIFAQTYDKWADALIKQIKEDEDLGKCLTVSNAGIMATIQPASCSNQTLQPAFQPNPRSMQYPNQN